MEVLLRRIQALLLFHVGKLVRLKYSKNYQKEQNSCFVLLHQSVTDSGQHFQFVRCFTIISPFLAIGENKQKVVGMMLELELGW